MKTIPARCRVCGKPLELELPEDGEINHTFVAMATCTPCVELLEKRCRALETITRGMTAHFRAVDDKTAAKGELLAKAREMLTEGTKSLALVTAEFYGKPGELIWTPRIVDALLAHKDRGWWRELTEYRNIIRAKLTDKKETHEPTVY